MNEILISIIIPVYNLEKYIADAINSCLNQDIPEEKYQIICVDDGSVDNSAQVIRDIQVKHPNVILHSQSNAGVSTARNNGLNLAEGKYVWFLDGDDMIVPNCLKLIIGIMEKTNADSFLFRSSHFTTNPKRETPSGKYKSCSEHTQLIRFMEYNGGAGVCGNVYKNEFLKSNSLYFNPKIKYSEDVLYNFKVLLKSRAVAKSEDRFLLIRDRAESTIHTTRLNLDKHMESMLFLAKEYNEMSFQQEEKVRKKLCIKKRCLAVRALLFGCFKKGKLKDAKEKVTILKDLGFYPFPLLWSTLIGHKSLRDFLIGWISFLFPCKLYFYFCVCCMQFFKSLSRRKK